MRRTTRCQGSSTINIRNLAGVPSVVYGLLGADGVRRSSSQPLGAGNGRNPDSTAMTTLGVLVLPIVIITSSEAPAGRPDADPGGGLLALGASRWEVTSRLVLPAAVPGHPDRDGARPGPSHG